MIKGSVAQITPETSERHYSAFNGKGAVLRKTEYQCKFVLFMERCGSQELPEYSSSTVIALSTSSLLSGFVKHPSIKKTWNLGAANKVLE